jgi:plastocyanin
MKKLFSLFIGIFLVSNAFALTHIIRVWSGYYIFQNDATGNNILFSPLTIQLGDTVQFLPLDPPTMMHTITSTNIPAGAASFDVMWQLPADTFFQYVPTVAGVYNFECTPHASIGMTGAFTVNPANVGLTAFQQAQDFLFFPNPTENLVNLRVNEQRIGSSISVYDYSGKVVLQNKINNADSRLSIENLSPGLYFLAFDNSGQKFKLIKQ